MSNCILNVVNDNTLVLKGRISFDNVVMLRDLGLKYIKSMAEVVVDLRDLSSCDSSVLALISSWIKFTTKNAIDLQIINPPTYLLDLSRFSGLKDILPFNFNKDK